MNEARAEGKLVCIMPCKEEEDEVKVHEVGREVFCWIPMNKNKKEV
jgi:hypothetical protein